MITMPSPPNENAYEHANEKAPFQPQITTLAVGEEDGGYYYPVEEA